MNSDLLYACSHCFKRFQFKDLTRDNHYCKKCCEKTIRYCCHCFRRFSPRDSYQNYCNTCNWNIKKYGKPTLCKFCKKKSTFGNQKCKKCSTKSKKLNKCKCCRMEYEKKPSADISLCWRCESTMQEPNSIEDSLESKSADSYSIYSPLTPISMRQDPFTQLQPSNNKRIEDKDNGSMTLKIPEKCLQDHDETTQRDQANKIHLLEKYLFKKDQELIGKDAEIIFLKAKCERIREVEEKMEILRKLDEQKETEKIEKPKWKISKFFKNNQHSTKQ